MEWAVLRAWYFERQQSMTYLDMKEESGIGHETLRKVVNQEKVLRGLWPADKALPEEFNPVHDTVLDLEAYFHHVMDVQSAAQADAANALRESPDAPLPADPAAAVLSMLSADEAVAREQIAGLEEALRAYKGPKPPPHRVAELFAFLYDKAKSAMPTYRRQRKPKQPKPPKTDAEQPPPGDADEPDAGPETTGGGGPTTD